MPVAPASYNRTSLERELEVDEAFRAKPYRCTAGKLTIGIGRNIDDVGITRDEALFLLRSDITKIEAQLDKNLPWWRKLSDARQRVLLNMTFNMGLRTMLTFERTLGLIQFGKYHEAAQAMLQSKWAKQVGERAERLSEMMKVG